jgi:hypothetical protein
MTLSLLLVWQQNFVNELYNLYKDDKLPDKIYIWKILKEDVLSGRCLSCRMV